MAMVDPDDDTLTRFVAQHYRYDPERHERRNVCLAAFDDQAEFEEFVSVRGAELRERQHTGEAELREHISGTVYEPGDRKRSQNQRLLSRAFDHGVWPSGWDAKNPPDGVHVAYVEAPDEPN
jgi:hypothetical protein